MDIRQLQYLVALAREKHFTRAAQACHVTQPTLSGRIRQLEQELGVPIVERGHRFHGLTPDGERVLKWANAILDNWTSLQQDIATLRDTSGALSGRLSVGVIPSALPMAALMTKAIQARHPQIELTILSQSSIEILRHLEDFSIDVGLTYLDNEPIEGMRSEAIYKNATACSCVPTTSWRRRIRSAGPTQRNSRCACSPRTCRIDASSIAHSGR
jgi:DNA-binding transcriptional LysR family regulator